MNPTATVPPDLSSNGLPLGEADVAPMRDSTALLDEPDALRARFAEDGYVLLRGVLDPAEVWALREDYFARLDPAERAPGSTAREGVYSGTTPADVPRYGVAGHPAHAVVRDARFDHLTRSAALHRVAEALLADRAVLLRRRILRAFTNGAPVASRAHVDFDYMDRGSDQAVTAWIPLGDAPIGRGGITYLEGSHRVEHAALDALRSHTDRPGDRRPVSNDLALVAGALGGRWLWTDFAAGDVALHSPHLVHASLDNHDRVVRLSADVRFVRHGAPVDERWNDDWSADDGF